MIRWIRTAVPTLATVLVVGLGEAGSVDVQGQIDVTGSHGSTALQYNWLNYGDTQFDAYRLRLFADGALPGGLQVFSQLLLKDTGGLRAHGAYVLYTPAPARDLHLMAGKIPLVIGAYAPRSYSDKKPLIGTPLMYQYHTALRADALPRTTDALVGAAGGGQYGPQYGSDGPGWRGMPVLYDACWDVGGVVTGSHAPIEYAIGMALGTPSAPAPSQDTNSGKSVLARLGVVPYPGIRAGVSGAWGPYLPYSLVGQMPKSKGISDYPQTLFVADAAFAYGHAELIAEAYHNRWASPWVGNLDSFGGYVEGKYALPFGTFAAGRWETMRFSDVTLASGERRAWDHDVDREEVGIGYRIQRGAVLKAVYQRTHFTGDASERLAAANQRYVFNLLAGQVSVRF